MTTTRTITFFLGAAATVAAVQLQTKDILDDIYNGADLAAKDAQEWTKGAYEWIEGSYDDILEWDEENGLDSFFRDLGYACENEDCDKILLEILTGMAIGTD